MSEKQELGPAVSIVITTRNRREVLCRAVESCLAQAYRPLHVVVYDDASTDGTEEVVRERFPEVTLARSAEQQGLIVQRNRGFRETDAEYVFSLDDDAYFTDASTVGAIVAQFQADARIGAIAIPFIDTAAPGGSEGGAAGEGALIRSYRGCAHAVRRRVALEVGAYRAFFVHQGEERDLCIRLQEAGWSIVQGGAPPVVHDASPVRDLERVGFYGVRNTLLFDFLNLPSPYMQGRLLADAWRLFAYKLTIGSLVTRLGYVTRGLGACFGYRDLRRPVSRPTYRAYRRLPGYKVLPRLAELAPSLTREGPKGKAGGGG